MCASAAADGKRKKNASIVRSSAVERAEETAATTRDRLQEALQNCDLMKSIGDYEEYLPLSTRVVWELRAIFECLGGMPSDGQGLILFAPGSTNAPVRTSPPPTLPSWRKDC